MVDIAHGQGQMPTSLAMHTHHSKKHHHDQHDTDDENDAEVEGVWSVSQSKSSRILLLANCG